MKPERDLLTCDTQLAIVEKYETVISYLYPIAQNMPRSHSTARDMFLACLLDQARLFIEAGKSNQVSRLYIADAGLATLRFWLRQLNAKHIHALSDKQMAVSLTHIAEVGKMLGRWIAESRRKGQAG